MRPKTRLFFFSLGLFHFSFAGNEGKVVPSLYYSEAPPLSTLSLFFLPVQFKGQGAIDKHVSARSDGAPFSSIFHGQSDPLENPSQ